MIGIALQAIWRAFGLIKASESGSSAFSGSSHRPRGLPGGGRFKTKAGRIHASESMRAGFSKPLLADGQLLTGYVHRYISELSPMEQHWLHFCYRGLAQKQGDSGHKFMRAYSQAYIELNAKGCRTGTRAIVREMVAFRMSQLSGALPMSAPFESSCVTISRKVWFKTFKEHWDKICDDLYRLDDSILYKIGCKLSLSE